jgi:transcriptional regulator GlxA family with amidase domain
MRTVGILVFDEVEISTFADIAALFSAAHDLVNSQPLFRTILIAQTMRAITCDSGFQFQPQATISDHPPLDILLIPGGRGYYQHWPESRFTDLLEVLVRPDGKGLRRERHNRLLLNWIREQGLRVEKIVGICTGMILLAECGLRNGYHATTHPNLAQWVQAHYPQVLLRQEQALVDTGLVVTAAGWNSALEAGLHIIAKAYGASTAFSAALRLDPHGRWLDAIGGTSEFASRLAGIESRVFRYSMSR